MSTITLRQTVGELVRENPARARVFEQASVDYCCGGKLPLEEACRKAGIDPAALIARLAACDERDGAEVADPDLAKMSLGGLADHIESRHHTYLWAELPKLEQLVQKVAEAHGTRDPRLVRVRDIYLGFSREMASHMLKEERILFPMIRELEQHLPGGGCGGGGGSCCCSGSVEGPIRQMEGEHDASGDALAQLRELTDGFAVTPDTCNTHRAMLDALARLERDTHQHVHKENNVLFPRAIEAQRARSVTGGAA